jgi:hypothetical protein
MANYCYSKFCTVTIPDPVLTPAAAQPDHGATESMSPQVTGLSRQNAREAGTRLAS